MQNDECRGQRERTPTQKRKHHELEERLIDFAAGVCQLAENLPNTRTGHHVAGQIIRCSTSPAPNYGEAQAAESRRDFIHKLRICLKELRETSVWLRFLPRASLAPQSVPAHLIDECNQLISIFVTSIRTANTNASK